MLPLNLFLKVIYNVILKVAHIVVNRKINSADL